MDKNEIRKWAKEKRSKLDMEALSKELAKKLQQTDEYRNAKNIMIFYPLKDEVNLLSLLEDKTKTFYLPKIDGENLLCCRYEMGETLCESCFHTKEPLGVNETPKSLINLVIVPALACDKNKYRLGYGGGFYDRFLEKLKVNTIVCIPKELIVETIYPEDFDIPVNKVITA